MSSPSTADAVIYTSSFPPVTDWQEDKGVFEFMFMDKTRPVIRSEVALVDAFTGAETSYGQLLDGSLALADGLVNKAKLAPQDTLLIFSQNSVLYPVLLFACTASLVTATTANSSYTPKELCHQIQNSSASVILVSSDLLVVCRAACKLAGLSEDRLYVVPGADGKIDTSSGLKSYETLLGNVNFKPLKMSREDLKTAVAYLPFSSGTTGQGKGVEVSHRNITAVSLQLQNVGIFQKDIVMGVLPLYHIYGLIVLLHQTLYNRGTVILLPKFDLPVFCASVQKYQATISLIVPPLALALARHPIVDNYDLSSLRILISGAAPLSAELQAQFETRLHAASKKLHGNSKPLAQVLQGYGMTETTSVALLPEISDTLVGSSGKLLSSMEARLVGGDGKDVKAGESGELWLRGNNIMLRYHRNEKATKETINEDGWLMTGDICIRSEAGHYSVVDRIKELIKYKGLQVIPSEIEALLLGTPLVADAAVIGVWEEELATELPRAYVVPSPEYANDPELAQKIMDYVAGKVAYYKKLRGGVRFLEVIPKSAAGKILRKDLRVIAAQEQADAKKAGKL